MARDASIRKMQSGLKWLPIEVAGWGSFPAGSVRGARAYPFLEVVDLQAAHLFQWRGAVVSSSGSYPEGRWFESTRRNQLFGTAEGLRSSRGIGRRCWAGYPQRDGTRVDPVEGREKRRHGDILPAVALSKRQERIAGFMAGPARFTHSYGEHDARRH